MSKRDVGSRRCLWSIHAIAGCGAVALLLFGNAMIWADEGDGIGPRAIPNPGVKTLRPAATEPSQQDNMLRQSPPPPRPGDLQPATHAEMEQHCLKNPRCGQKLNQARQGLRPSAPLPSASAQSLEDNLLRLGPPPPGQRLPLQGPRSYVPTPVERLLSWLNPFSVDQAWAQTPFTVTLTPDSRQNAQTNSWLGLAGGSMTGSQPAYFLWNVAGVSTNEPRAENKAYVYISSNIPTAGYYLMDIVSSPSLAKLRHNSGQILETWDDRAGCGGPSTCHHATVDYYTAGPHYWHFWGDPTATVTLFYSVTLKSYP